MSLFLISTVFVLIPLMNDFLKGSTNYSLQNLEISLDDLPTVSLCVELRGKRIPNTNPQKYDYERMLYGKAFTIDVKVIEHKNNTITLEEDTSIQTLYGIQVSLKEFRQTRNEKWQCYQIVMKSNGNHAIEMDIFRTQIIFKFESYSLFPENAYVWLTSEDNSYGLVGGKWFDGDVTKLTLENSYFKGILLPAIYQVKVFKVTEYIGLISACSPDSYYKCLAERFANYNTTQKCNQVAQSMCQSET